MATVMRVVCLMRNVPPGSTRFLHPEAQRAQRRLVVEVKETGRRRPRVPVLEPVPGRRHKAIARLPGEGGVADPGLAPALDHVEDATARATRSHQAEATAPRTLSSEAGRFRSAG